jgi:hypothetical protein
MMPLTSSSRTPDIFDSPGHEIQVLDDFLPRAGYYELADLISNEPLVYGSRSNPTTDPHGHWTRGFAQAGLMNLADVSSDLGLDDRLGPLMRAWEFLRDTQLANDVLIRCYLNGYTYGTDSYFHVDSQRPDEHTTIVYITDYWDPDWAGETVFLDTHDEIVKSVLPKVNRAVIFPANVKHAARGVSRKCPVLRKTLIFKTRKRRSSNFERLSAFLRRVGAAKYGHQSGSLHDHLVRTFSLLEERRFDESVCFGGGLHSVYGTNAYGLAVLTPRDRATVAEEFGVRAEELASLFGMLERPQTLESPRELTDQAAVVELRGGQTMSLQREMFDDLRKIECANLTDQNELSKHGTLSAIWLTQGFDVQQD